MSTISSRVAMAVHVLAFLARRRGEAVTSDTIAGSVNTNPVVVRRLMGSLRNAGLVQVQPGARGGAQLAREPQDITVLDVYRAVEEKPDLFALHAEPRGDCDIGGNIRGVLRGVFCRAHEAMQRELGAVTIADVLHDVTGRSCCGPQPAKGECRQPAGRQQAEAVRRARPRGTSLAPARRSAKGKVPRQPTGDAGIDAPMKATI